MSPGLILLFGHVNILFSSLLSKSLTIKGREARPGRERGRAGMPRSTTRSQAIAAAGAASSMEAAMPVLSATAEPADLSQPAAAVQSINHQGVSPQTDVQAGWIRPKNRGRVCLC